MINEMERSFAMVETDEPISLEASILAVLEKVKASNSSLDAFERLKDAVENLSNTGGTAYDLEESLFHGGMELLRMILKEQFQKRDQKETTTAIEVQTEENIPVRLGEHRRHERQYESVFGTISIDRIGYGKPGYESIHVFDEVLNLPTRKYSYILQKKGAELCGRMPYDEAITTLESFTAGHIPRRQLEEIVQDAACDFEAFYEEQECNRTDEAVAIGDVVVVGIDCKGVPKRRSEEEIDDAPGKRIQKGEKRVKKKMATVASVHTTIPDVRKAEDVVNNLMGERQSTEKRKHPKPENRRLWASLHKSKDDMMAEIVEEMNRRDPLHAKQVVCVMDGERALRKRANAIIKKKFPTMVMVLDIIHVLDYLWDAAYAFYDEGTFEAKDWVKTRLLFILQGRVSYVAAGIRQSATKKGVSNAKRAAVDRTCNYFLSNVDRMRYDQYLAKGLPIASGAVEGACGHLVKDRMERTGALWNVDGHGAEAVLKIRALDKSGDFARYWKFHMKKECARNYDKDWKIAA